MMAPQLSRRRHGKEVPSMLYALTLFVHILGALALFAAFGLE